MTIKSIWKDYWNSVKTSAKECWISIRAIAKSTFELFKSAGINFIQGIYTWLVELITQVCKVLWSLLSLICGGLLKASLSTLACLAEKAVESIKKW